VRLIVYGAGGVGSVIGASLFSHNYQTVLVGNSDHVDSIGREGLRLVTPDSTKTLKVKAVKTAEEVAPFGEGDVVLLTAKSQHTIRCLGQLKNAGAPKTLPIFCCQNSIWNEPTASRVFDNVYGVVVTLPATFLKPGEVYTPLSGIKGHLEIGRYPSGTDSVAEEVTRSLSESDFDACLNESVMKAKGAKCLANLLNPVDAITDSSGSEEFTAHVREEAERIWKAAGIEWESLESYSKRSRSKMQFPRAESPGRRGGSSTWQSMVRGTGNVEAGEINGDVVTIGKFLGIQTPYNECLWRVCADMALKNEKPGKYSLSDLEGMVAERSWPVPAQGP
jgi:2-dehydropantoate 2-reductase